MSTLTYDATFTGSCSAPAAGGTIPAANEVVATGTAGGWKDVTGGEWLVSSGLLHGANNTGTYTTDYLVRPSGESIRDCAMVAQLPATGDGADSVHWFVMRWSSPNTAYLFQWSYNQVIVYKMVSGSPTQVGSTVTLSPTMTLPSSAYTLAAQVTGTTTVTITLEVRSGATIGTTGFPTGGTLLGSATITDSSPPAALQAAGLMGLTQGSTGSNYGHYNRIQTYNAGAASPSLTVSPTTATATDGGATVSITATLTNSAAALTAAISPASGAGTISTTTPTSGTPFTYTPPASGSGTATVTVTDATDSLSGTCTITYAPAAALTMGALTLNANPGTGSVTIGWSAATGGTGTGYSYALYRYSSAPFTPPGTGTLVGTTAGTSLVDSSPGGSVVYYRVVVTDSGSNTATSTQSGNQGALCVGVATTPISIGFVGDSITAGQGASVASPTNASFAWTSSVTYTDAVTNCAAALAAGAGNVAVEVTNRGIGGTTSADWATIASGDLSGAVTAFNAASPPVTVVHIQLGTNDAKTAVNTSAATYKSNLQSIISYLQANVPTLQLIVLSPPYYVVPGSGTNAWNEASLPVLRSYHDQLSALDNGATVRFAEAQNFEHFADNTAQLTDGIHPTDAGHAALGKLWARSIRQAQVAASGGATYIFQVES